MLHSILLTLETENDTQCLRTASTKHQAAHADAAHGYLFVEPAQGLGFLSQSEDVQQG
jgi:hypothetical protein